MSCHMGHVKLFQTCGPARQKLLSPQVLYVSGSTHLVWDADWNR